MSDVIGPHIRTPEAVALLRRSRQLFPESARFADLLGYALAQTGQHAESHAVHAQALGLRRKAIIFNQEYPKDVSSLLLWQLGEHLEGQRA